jgi:hypothetical protein
MNRKTLEKINDLLGAKIDAGLSNRDYYKALSEAKNKSDKYKGKTFAEIEGELNGKSGGGNTGAEKKADVDQKGGSTKAEVITVKSEPATANAAARSEITAPVIHMVVPSPTVNIEAHAFPGWYGMASNIWHTGLYMIVGAAAGQWFGASKMLVKMAGGW